MILVTSGWILFAMPKSINFSEAFTMTKFAGFRSLCTIPTHKIKRELLKNRIMLEFHTTFRMDAAAAVKGRGKDNHVCGWFGQPPACSSSRTFSPVDSHLCAFVTMCSGPSFRTPLACRCSCWLFHCKQIYSHCVISNGNCEYEKPYREKLPSKRNTSFKILCSWFRFWFCTH